MEFKLKMVKKVVLGIFSCAMILFIGCDNEPKQKETVEPETKVITKPRITAPSFNEDSAYLFTKIQVDFGPRVPESKAHAKAAEWFQKQLKAYGAKVTLQTGSGKTFDGKQYAIKNIIASYNDSAKDRILLCAHWDTRPFADKDSINKNKAIDGANDGASGVAVLMEIARLIKNNPPNVGIDIILFDLEDYGRGEVEGYDGNEDTWCLGSKYWSENKHQAGYNARFGILLDMVGGFNPSFPKEGYSLYYANGVVDKVWLAAKNIGYAAIFKDNTSSTITDDHVNINKIAGIPCIDILNYDENLKDFNAHHHKHSDNLKNIDKKTLAIVGQVVLDVIYNE